MRSLNYAHNLIELLGRAEILRLCEEIDKWTDLDKGSTIYFETSPLRMGPLYCRSFRLDLTSLSKRAMRNLARNLRKAFTES